MKKKAAVGLLIFFLAALSVFLTKQTNWAFLSRAPSYRWKGAEKPKVTLVEFSDFQCPSCARAQPFLKELLKRHEGELAVLFRHFPLKNHPWAIPAARAAESAGIQGKFWEYHDLLFQNQDVWVKSSNPQPFFLQYAEQLGLDSVKFRSAMDESRWESVILRDREDGLSLGIRSTPTFLVNRRRMVGDTQLLESGERYIELEKIHGQ